MEKKRLFSVRFAANAAVIAAIYVVLTYVFAWCASGAVQVRVAEALTILPVFTTAAIPGLAVGCLLANLLTGCALWDVVFGTLATLLGAIGTRLLRKRGFLASLPPILANVLIVPWVLRFVYGDAWPVWLLMLTVGAGELISCGVLGGILLITLKKYPMILFHQE